MPYLLIVTDDEVADPRKLAAAVDNGATIEALGADGWLAYVDLDDGGGGDAKRRKSRARQRRYRARKRADDGADDDAPRNAVTRNAVTRGDAERYADDAEILEIRPGSNSLSLGRERVTAGNVTRNVTRNGVTRDAGSVTRNASAEDWRGDRAPLDDDERARAQAGLAAARQALRRVKGD
jgi:hypothetical protein